MIEWSYTDPQAEAIAAGSGWITPPPAVVERVLAKLDGIRCMTEAGEIMSCQPEVTFPSLTKWT